MKNNNSFFSKALILLTASAIVFQQCQSETCDYVTQPCSNDEPAGFMVGTMCSDVNSINPNSVAVLYKTLNNSTAPIGNNWNDPSAGANRVERIFPANWSSDKIGEIFGIALDHNKGIYLAATDVYKFDYYLPGSFGNWSSGVGPAGAAGIYYTNYNTINTTTALVTTLNSSNANTVGTKQIPSTGFATSMGNSIGNIAFDYKNNQLFATNLEDGRIYRIDATTGIVKSILDPFSIDDGNAGISTIGEQLWGIGIYTFSGTTKVFFARSTQTHIGNGSSYGGVEIWSVNLTSSGEFNATSSGGGLFTATTSGGYIKKELDVTNGYQTKVTDIAFSSTGKMLLAERGHPHRSGIFEYTYTGTSFTTGNNFYLGWDLNSINSNYLKGKNASGGVDYSSREIINSGGNNSFNCNDIVWATLNAGATKLLPQYPGGMYPNFIYGAQGMSSAGNSSTLSVNTTNDLYIDYNCTGWSHFSPSPGVGYVKGKIGDIEFFDQCSCQ